MKKGTSPEAAGSARVAALVALAGIVLFVAIALSSPAAHALPKSVCCFRITVEVTGEAHADYTRVDPHDDQGQYAYLWNGTAFGLAHLQGSDLITDRGLGAGYLGEINNVLDYTGRPRDHWEHDCPQGGSAFSGGRFELGKTRHGYPRVWLEHPGGWAFDTPFEDWELHCGSLASEALQSLEEGNFNWAFPRQFFDYGHLSGLSAGMLAKGHSQEVICIQTSRPPAQPRLQTIGFSAVSVAIVPFPSKKLKHQQEWLTGLLGESEKVDDYKGASRPITRLSDKYFEGKPVPKNGCHPG
jgi:hypothetical protein